MKKRNKVIAGAAGAFVAIGIIANAAGAGDSDSSAATTPSDSSTPKATHSTTSTPETSPKRSSKPKTPTRASHPSTASKASKTPLDPDAPDIKGAAKGSKYYAAGMDSQDTAKLPFKQRYQVVKKNIEDNNSGANLTQAWSIAGKMCYSFIRSGSISSTVPLVAKTAQTNQQTTNAAGSYIAARCPSQMDGILKEIDSLTGDGA